MQITFLDESRGGDHLIAVYPAFLNTGNQMLLLREDACVMYKLSVLAYRRGSPLFWPPYDLT